MLRRGLLFLWMNIAVLIVLTLTITVLEKVFGITLDLYGFNYVSILIFSVIIWFTWSFISLALSKWIAKKAYRIKLIQKDDVYSLSEKEKIVWQVVEDLAERHHITMPEVGIYQDRDPNAFATGASKNKSLIAVSSGLLDVMDRNAVEWVVAHEMAHVLNGDMVTMALLQWVLNTFVIFFARIISNLFNSYTDGKFWMLWYFAINIALQILFGIWASLILMKFSRYREFRADEGSARFVWKEKMIAGLKALKNVQLTASPDSAELAAMKISTRKKTWMRALFSSHPDLDDRIRRLEDLII